MIRHQAAAVLAALALTGASACGGGQRAARLAAPAGQPPCTARTGVALPDGWPTSVPLPTGLVVNRTDLRSGGRLIAYGRVVVTDDELILPHPRAAQRRFVMGPLAQIAPDWVHPVSGKTAASLATDATVGRDAEPI